MRAMAVTAYDAPLEPIEVPEPALRPGTALLEVLTCGVCFSDVKTSRGLMPFSRDLPLPHVPGHEIFGRVLASELVYIGEFTPDGQLTTVAVNRGGQQVENLTFDLDGTVAGHVQATGRPGQWPAARRLAAPAREALPAGGQEHDRQYPAPVPRCWIRRWPLGADTTDDGRGPGSFQGRRLLGLPQDAVRRRVLLGCLPVSP